MQAFGPAELTNTYAAMSDSVIHHSVIVCIFEHVQRRWALNDSTARGLRTIASTSGSGVVVRREYSWMCLRCFGVTASTPGHTCPWLGQWCGRGLPSAKWVV